MSKQAQTKLQQLLSESDVGQIPFREAVESLADECGVQNQTAKQYVYKYANTEENVFGDKFVKTMKRETESDTATQNTTTENATKQTATEEVAGHIEDDISRQELEAEVGGGTGVYYDGKNFIKEEEWVEEHGPDEPIPGLEVLEDVGHPLVPDLDYQYLKRRLVGNYTDVEITVDAMADEDFSVLLEGETGVGKGVLIKFICMQTNRPLIPVNFDEGITFDQLVGHYGPAEDGGFEWKPGFLQYATERGYTFLADELNAAPGEITMALHGLTEDRSNRRLDLREKGEIIKPHEQFRFVGTMNPAHAGYAGAKNLNDAFQTRFYTIEIDYMDAKAEVQHILEKAGNHITEREARRLVDLAGNLRAMYPKEINTPISTRELIKVAKMKRRLSLVDSTKLIFGGIAEPTDKDAINKAIKTTLGKN